MFISLWFLLTTCLIIRKLDIEEDEFREEDREAFFGVRMFTCDPYYEFLEYLHGKKERSLSGFITLGGCCGIFVIEIIIFIIIHAAIMSTNVDGKDYAVFWFMAYIFTEGCIIVTLIAFITLSKCWSIYSSVNKKREELRLAGYSQTDIKEEMKSVDIFAREEDYSNMQPTVNTKLEEIRANQKQRKQAQEELNRNYKPIFGNTNQYSTQTL